MAAFIIVLGAINLLLAGAHACAIGVDLREGNRPGFWNVTWMLVCGLAGLWAVLP